VTSTLELIAMMRTPKDHGKTLPGEDEYKKAFAELISMLEEVLPYATDDHVDISEYMSRINKLKNRFELKD